MIGNLSQKPEHIVRKIPGFLTEQGGCFHYLYRNPEQLHPGPRVSAQHSGRIFGGVLKGSPKARPWRVAYHCVNGLSFFHSAFLPSSLHYLRRARRLI